MSVKEGTSEGAGGDPGHRYGPKGTTSSTRRKRIRAKATSSNRSPRRPEVAVQQQNLINLDEDRRESRVKEFVDFANELKVKTLRFNIFWGPKLAEQLSVLKKFVKSAGSFWLQLTIAPHEDIIPPSSSTPPAPPPKPKYYKTFPKRKADWSKWIEGYINFVKRALKHINRSPLLQKKVHGEKRIRRISIWNEPNDARWLRSKGSSGQGRIRRCGQLYVELYRQTYEAIQSSKYEILIGELSSRNAVEFLEAMAKHIRLTGKPLYADGLALHPYQYQRRPGKKDSKFNGGIGSLKKILAKLRTYAREKLLVKRGTSRAPLPLYLTEFGYHWSGDTRRVLSATQRSLYAKYTEKAFQVAARAGARQMLYYQIISAQGESWDTAIVDSDAKTKRKGFGGVKAWNSMTLT